MSEKKPMKMKRVDFENTGGTDGAKGNEEVSSMEIKQVHNFNGVSVMASDEDIAVMETSNATKEDSVQKVGVMEKNEAGVISVSTDDEMEEVSYEEWAKAESSDLSKGVDLRSELDNLVSMDEEEAKKKLIDLKDKGRISSYRIMPIGAPFTFDVIPGRVQVLIDAAKKVIQTHIG